jgi:hypothetical protein
VFSTLTRAVSLRVATSHCITHCSAAVGGRRPLKDDTAAPSTDATPPWRDVSGGTKQGGVREVPGRIRQTRACVRYVTKRHLLRPACSTREGNFHNSKLWRPLNSPPTHTGPRLCSHAWLLSKGSKHTCLWPARVSATPRVSKSHRITVPSEQPAVEGEGKGLRCECLY